MMALRRQSTSLHNLPFLSEYPECLHKRIMSPSVRSIVIGLAVVLICVLVLSTIHVAKNKSSTQAVKSTDQSTSVVVTEAVYRDGKTSKGSKGKGSSQVADNCIPLASGKGKGSKSRSSTKGSSGKGSSSSTGSIDLGAYSESPVSDDSNCDFYMPYS